jgi:hypothetical protein
MAQPIGNPASAATLGGVGNDALAGSGVRSPYSKSRGPKLVEPRQGSPRHIQVVHHGSAAGVHTWHVVVYDGASRTSVANFATKREAMSQLGFLAQKLRARIVGRGAPR